MLSWCSCLEGWKKWRRGKDRLGSPLAPSEATKAKNLQILKEASSFEKNYVLKFGFLQAYNRGGCSHNGIKKDRAFVRVV
jgi:hypothetical protein